MTSVPVPAHLAAQLDRELRALRRELEAYPDERQIWEDVSGLPNSAGTLALHVAGNLQHFIGAQWGETGYVRDRKAEFARRGVPRAELLEEVERARAAVAAGLQQIPLEALGEPYPLTVARSHLDTSDYLVHLCAHLAYHLGQLDAHRRIVTGNVNGVGAVRPEELGSARPAEE